MRVVIIERYARRRQTDRTQALLPMRPCQIGRRTHDDDRHGATTLLAALNAKTGEVITQFHQRHRSGLLVHRAATGRHAGGAPVQIGVHRHKTVCARSRLDNRRKAFIIRAVTVWRGTLRCVRPAAGPSVA